MSLTFPTVNQDEIGSWIQLTAHEPVANIDGEDAMMDDDTFGSALGNTINIQAPNQIILGDSHNYNSMQLKALLGGMAAWEAEGQVLKDLIDAAKAAGSDFPVIGDVMQTFNYMDQKAVNPREELVFAKPNFRAITLSWELAMQEVSDSTTLKQMIEQLRKYSYPELASSFMYKAPAQWRLAVVSRADSDGGPQYFQFGKCILESMSTNYTGAGLSAITKGGTPAFINLELNFKEVKLRNQSSTVLN